MLATHNGRSVNYEPCVVLARWWSLSCWTSISPVESIQSACSAMSCLLNLTSLSFMIVLSPSNLPYTNHLLNVYRRSCLSVWRQLVTAAIRWTMPIALELTIKTTLRGFGWLNDFFSPVLWLLLSICQREMRCSQSLLAKINDLCCCCYCSNSLPPALLKDVTQCLWKEIFLSLQKDKSRQTCFASVGVSLFTKCILT